MEILRQIYSQICTLEDWVIRVDRNGWLGNNLVQDTDSEKYKELLKSTVVAEKQGQEEFPDISTFEQVSQQRELLLRVIQKLKRRNEKNVLTLGFTTASDNIGAQVSHVNDLEYLYPNSCFNRLQYPVWCKLLSRIGDTAMEYLLTSTSMFIEAPNSSYIQLTGVPVYELWSLAPGTFHFNLQICSKTTDAQKRKRHTLKNTMKKKCTQNFENKKLSSKIVSVEPYIQNSGNTETKTSSCIKRKKKKKIAIPEFSPYEYHTNINRIQMLYAKNLRERFHSNYILNLIPPTEDGALTLYRHILEHKQTIFTKKADITWVFPEPSKDSICHDSSCCSVQNVTQLNDPELYNAENHDSFFLSGHSVDRLLLEQRSLRSTQGSDKQMQGSDKQTQGSDKQTQGSDKQIQGLEKQTQGLDKQTQDSEMLSQGPERSDAKKFENRCENMGTDEITDKYNAQTTDRLKKISTNVGLMENPCDKICVEESSSIDLADRTVHSNSIFSTQSFETGGNDGSLNYSQGFDTSGNESSHQNESYSGEEKQKIFDAFVCRSDKNSQVTSGDEHSISFTKIKDQNLTSDGNISMLHVQFSSTPLEVEDTNINKGCDMMHCKSRKRKYDGDYPEAKRHCISIESSMPIDVQHPVPCQNDDMMMETDEGTFLRKCSDNEHQESKRYLEESNSEKDHSIKTVISSVPSNETVISNSPNINTAFSNKSNSEAVVSNSSNTETIISNGLNAETVTSNRPNSDSVKSNRPHTETTISNRPNIEMPISNGTNTKTSKSKGLNTEAVTQNEPGAETVVSNRPNIELDKSSEPNSETVIKRMVKPDYRPNTETVQLDTSNTEPEKMEQDKKLSGNVQDGELMEQQHGDSPTETENDGQRNNNLSVKVEFISTFQNLLQKILVKHRKCPYKYLLDYYCPERTQKKCHVYKRGQKCFVDMQLTRMNTIREHLHNFIPYRQVYLFVRRVCLFVIPEELWGTRSNRNHFLRNIKRIINLNKFDKFCIGQLMSGVQVKSITWLKVVKSNSVRQHITAKLWHWIVEEFVIHVIKTYFYITDTTQHVNRLFYYRKNTWQWLHIKGLSDLMKRNIMKIIPQSTVRKLMTERKALGVGCLRFFPKSKGLRPIINLSKQQTVIGQPSIPINKQLLNLLQVLSLIKKNNPDIVGAARFGLDEIYKVWKEFSVKQGCPLYFVKTDISSCYDEILQHKLFSIIRNIFANPERVSEEYFIRRYVKIVREGGMIKRKFIRKACQLCDYRTDFILFIKQQSQQESFHDVIFVDQVVTQQETREQLLKQLHSHIFHNIIKVGQSYYQQTKGISQGSVISTLLCNIYYGEMEKRFPVEEGELMMRIVDDALFVTPSKERAVTYCQQMVTGLPDFNFSINHNKVLTNFECDIPGLEDIPVLDNTDWLSWCGILLNMKTLEATVNLSFYFNCFLEDSMTFDTACKPGLTVKRKLFRSLRLKCHPLYIDSQLNSMNVVIINIYKMFLVSVFKFIQYIKHLSRKDNYGFLISLIKELGQYFYLIYTDIIKHKIQGKTKEVDKLHIQWLCTHAYIIKLNEHRSQYKPVVSILQQCKKHLGKKIQGPLTTCYMESICGRKLLEDFKRIR